MERFFPGGPFAILPMKGGYTSSIVWTEKSEISKMLMDLSEEEFIIELKKRFGSYLGEIKLEGERKLYPLSFAFAKSYIRVEFCLSAMQHIQFIQLQVKGLILELEM
nr:hypothetical protein [Wolbachia endosymbiont of Kradibia gibbosae]